jgi:hypothetical protein
MRAYLLVTFALLAQVLHGQVTIDPPSRSFGKDGGAAAILTLGSGSWNATTSNNWLTITPRATGNATQSCIYVVGSNFSADNRTGQIEINGQIHTVNQTGYTASLTPSSATVDLDGGSGTVNISVAAGVSWSTSSNSDWISVTTASGTSSSSVSYTVDPNPGVTVRTGSITIAGQTFSVTQTGTDINLSPKEVEKAYSSDIVQLQVTALINTNWNVTPNASWISVVDDGNGFGDSQITLAVGTNPSYNERTGTVSIGSATFTIRQFGTPNPVLDIIPDEATANPIGAFGNVAVLATPDAAWTANSLSPWIVISDGASGAGNGNIEYVASANTTLSSRVGLIEVIPPVYEPAVDLTRGLVAWYLGRDDLTGWERHLENAFDDFSFDGRTKVYVNSFGFGDDSYYRSDAAFSISFGFEVQELGTTHRLFAIDQNGGGESTIYVNEQDKLVVSVNGTSYVSDFIVQANVLQHVLLTQDANRQIKLYFGTKDSDSFSLTPYTTVLGGDFFPASTTKDALKFGHSDYPSPGILTGKLRDIRAYTRVINTDEVKALNEQLIVDSYSRYRGITTGGRTFNDLAPTSTFDTYLTNYKIKGFNDGDYLASPETQYEGRLLGHFAEDSLESKFPQEAVYVGSGWNYNGGSSYAQRYTMPHIGAREDIGTWNSGFIRHGWPNNAHFAFGTEMVLISTDGTLHDSYSDPRFYITETEIPDAVTTLARSSYMETNDTLLYRNEFKNNGLGAIRLPFRLTGATSASDRLGRAQSALSWENTDASFSLEGTQAPHNSTNATYALWLKFDSLPSGELTLIDRRQVASQNPQFRVDIENQGTQIQLIVDNDSAKSATFPISLSTDRFHHLAFSCSDENFVKVFLDGSEIGNTPLMTGYKFGAWQESFQVMTLNGWDGVLDDFAVYDSALSSSQIRAIYNQEKPLTIYHTVTQGVVSATLNPADSSIPAAGGSKVVDLTLAGNVSWSASADTAWISITSNTSGSGSTTLAYDVTANTSVYERTGTLTIAGETHTVTQAGLNATLDYEELVFGTDGGSDWVDVFPEGNASWQATSNESWLTIASGSSGAGSGSVLIVADPYTQTSQSRTGTIEVAGQQIYVTQRGYQLSVSPEVAQVSSNAGAGEVGVAAPLTAVWEAITTEDWITIIGGNSGIGSGTLRYSVAENTTGAPRTGRIIISGTEYTITQVSDLRVSVTAGIGGTVNGGGSYQTNATAILTATADSGYVFSHWTGGAVGSANPFSLSVDSDKDITAHFIPLSAASAFEEAGRSDILANPSAYELYNEDQFRAMAVGRPFLEVDSATNKVIVGFGLKESDELSNWSSVDIQSSQTFIRDGNIEVELTVDQDAKFYQIITE